MIHPSFVDGLIHLLIYSLFAVHCSVAPQSPLLNSSGPRLWIIFLCLCCNFSSLVQSLWNKFFQDKELKGMIKQDVLRTSVSLSYSLFKHPKAFCCQCEVSSSYLWFHLLQVPRDPLLPGRGCEDQVDGHPLLLCQRKWTVTL